MAFTDHELETRALRSDFARTLTLLGVTSAAGLGRSHVRLRGWDWAVHKTPKMRAPPASAGAKGGRLQPHRRSGHETPPFARSALAPVAGLCFHAASG